MLKRTVLFPILLLLVVTTLCGARQAAAAATRTVPPERIRRFMTDYLADHQHMWPRAQLRFKALELPAELSVPAGRLSCDIYPADRRILPSRRFTLILRVDGRAVENLSLQAEVEALATVAVAAHPLRGGVVLSADDILTESRDLATLRSPCFEAAELVGKRLRRSMRQAEAFRRTDLRFPPVIKHGDMVTITARKGALCISAKGQAQENGRAGGTIRVRNISSRKDIQARVTGPGQVEVEL